MEVAILARPRTKRFNGWFSADNPVAKPQVHPDTPERLLHVLSLKPNS